MPTNKDQVRDLLAKGLKVRDVAKVLDITTQRVYQLKNEIEAEQVSAQRDVGAGA